MPKRQSTTRHDSDAVQGADSWVETRNPTWGEKKALRREAVTTTSQVVLDDAMEPEERIKLRLDQMDATNDWAAEQVIKFVVAWNWVDDDGDPLPTPKDDPSVLDRLTSVEMEFLAAAVIEEYNRDAAHDWATKRKN